jgi:transcriptional regulator with XRE-family HTH domain
MTDRFESSQSLEDQLLLQEFPALKDLWGKTHLKRLVGILFSRMRKVAGMSQRDIAGMAGWDKAFISRLEGVDGGVPDLQTICRYADACNMDIGIVVSNRPGDAGYVRIVDAVSLNKSSEGVVSVFDTLRDREIEITKN